MLYKLKICLLISILVVMCLVGVASVNAESIDLLPYGDLKSDNFAETVEHTVGVIEGDVINNSEDSDTNKSVDDKEAPYTHYYPAGGTVGVTPSSELSPYGGTVGVKESEILDDVTDPMTDEAPYTHYYADGEKPVFLTEYPEEFLPYVEELERINAKIGTDYTFGILASEAEDNINFYTSMTMEEFRNYIYEAYENDIANPPFEGYKVTEINDVDDVDIVNHNGGFWYFADSASAEPDNDHKVEGAILDENGEIDVIPNGELSPDNNVMAHEYGVDEPREPHDFTKNSTVGNAGVYRGDGWVYSCDCADDKTSVREVEQNYDEQKTKYGQMLPTDYTDIPQEVTYGIMTDIDGLIVSHMKYVSDGKTEIYTDREGEKVAELNYINTQNAEIVFENGSIASEEDLTPGSAVFVEYDVRYETYPGKMRCTRIVILQ